MTVSINGTTGLTFNDASTQNTAATGFGFKNRLINSAMMIDQRNAGASVTPTNGQYTLDRWTAAAAQSNKYSVQQNAGSVTPPAGFNNYLGVTSLSSYSLGADEVFAIAQGIEGFNFADMAWGTASASPVTLSFWVRSSLTGTFGGTVKNAMAGANRSYPFSYTINSANTWEQKTITIAGDTSGTWNKTNGCGVEIGFALGVSAPSLGTAGSWAGANYWSATGATSVVGTNGATFYITGVQLEKGSTATSFDYRPYTTELQLCQRYLPVHKGNGSGTSYSGFGIGSSTTRVYADLSFQVEPRVPPTGITTSAASSVIADDGVNGYSATSIVFATGNNQYGLIRLDFASGITQFRPYYLGLNSGAYILWTGCEL